MIFITFFFSDQSLIPSILYTPLNQIGSNHGTTSNDPNLESENLFKNSDENTNSLPKIGQIFTSIPKPNDPNFFQAIEVKNGISKREICKICNKSVSIQCMKRHLKIHQEYSKRPHKVKYIYIIHPLTFAYIMVT